MGCLILIDGDNVAFTTIHPSTQ